MRLLSKGYLLDHLEEVAGLLKRKPVGLLSDLDGTLSEIVPNPDGTMVSEPIRNAIRELRLRMAVVAIVTGRPVRQACDILGLPDMIYIGNHGFERMEDGQVTLTEEVSSFASILGDLWAGLKTRFARTGLIFEDKGGSFSLHYRSAEDPGMARDALLEAIETMAGGQVRVLMGKQVINVLPPLDLTKGTAVTSLVKENSLSGVILMGDDVTDIDAFRAANRLSRSHGLSSISIAVLGPDSPRGLAEEADFSLSSVGEVEGFLKWLVEQTGRPKP